MRKRLKFIILIIVIFTVGAIAYGNINNRRETKFVEKYAKIAKTLKNTSETVSFGTLNAGIELGQDNGSKLNILETDNTDLKKVYNIQPVINLVLDNLNKRLEKINDVRGIELSNKDVNKKNILSIPMIEVYKDTGLVSEYKYLNVYF